MEISAATLRELLGVNEQKTTTSKIDKPSGGMYIVIADRGFVWAGLTTVDGDFCRIENARNLRIWGTTKGLGELADGPLSSTKIDHVGTVDVPMRAVIGFIKCNKIW